MVHFLCGAAATAPDQSVGWLVYPYLCFPLIGVEYAGCVDTLL
jgi:hypothetical protein